MMTNFEVAHEMEIVRSFYEGGKFDEAFEKLTPLVDMNCTEALVLAGYMHWLGQGVPINHEEAVLLFSKAMDNGSIIAGYYEACLLEADNKIEESIECHKKCSIKGNISSSYALYRMGKKYPNLIDRNEGEQYLNKAFAGGHSLAVRDKSKKMIYGEYGFFMRFNGLYLFINGLFNHVNLIANDPYGERLR